MRPATIARAAVGVAAVMGDVGNGRLPVMGASPRGSVIP
jgi:hypothetical protein